MVEKQDKEVRVRCPYCKRVFLFKPKKHKAEGGPVRHRKTHCPYCDSPLILPGDIGS